MMVVVEAISRAELLEGSNMELRCRTSAPYSLILAEVFDELRTR